jgi:hypothetical protein
MIAKKAKKYPYSNDKEEDVVPEEELPEDPFIAAADVDEVDDVDADDDEIDDGISEEEDEEEKELIAHGFHLVTGEEDDNAM